MFSARRIIILGPSGAGKSTLAREMGHLLAIPVVHLDALFWNPGWIESRLDHFRTKVAAAATQDAWVMDGNYFSTLDLRLPRVEAAIWLDLPRSIFFTRAIFRVVRNYGRERGDTGVGNPERFDFNFFRNWVWTYPTRGRAEHAEFMMNLPSNIQGITLTTTREVSNFVKNLHRTEHSTAYWIFNLHADYLSDCPTRFWESDNLPSSSPITGEIARSAGLWSGEPFGWREINGITLITGAE